jgi:hypothetical protein
MPGVPLPSLPSASARSINFKASRVRWPEWVVAVSALALLLIMLALSWFTFERASGGPGRKYYTRYSENGWDGLPNAHWLLLLTIVVAFALFAVQAGRRSPAVPVTLSFLVAVLAAASTIWLIVRVAIDPPGGREVGGWLALICAAVLTWSGYKSLRMEGVAPEDEPSEIPTIRVSDLPPTSQAEARS